MKRFLNVTLALCLIGPVIAAPTERAVLEHYANLDQAKYEDSLNTAVTLRTARPATDRQTR